MENLLLATNGRLVISDFRKAVILDTDFKLPYTHGKNLILACLKHHSIQEFVRSGFVDKAN